MISQLSALKCEIGTQTCYESQTAGGQREIHFLLKKGVNLQYFAKFVLQKWSSKFTSKTSLMNSGRKKDSDNKSVKCFYWPLAHITRTIIATQIRQTISIYTVVSLLCCAFRKTP